MNSNVGIGFDTHKLIKSGDLIIGGVIINNEYSLEGDSDGDVLIHAIIDSLLGAAGLGDIGHYFNKNNHPKSSLKMLKKTNDLLINNNFIVNNIDSTVVCEQFSIKEYSQEMKNEISLILCVKPNQINIKGKSTDGLGFLGEKKGIAALAISSLSKNN
jgi:2-C-methyl-D-erythritol 2,4-cyclodiphosphate synthase